MALDYLTQGKDSRGDAKSHSAEKLLGNLTEAEKALQELANVFLQQKPLSSTAALELSESAEWKLNPEAPLLNMEAKYRALVEQIPAVVFMAYLDKGIGEAYVSPQIETALGFSQSEWLEDPVRWYQQIHPDDKMRWSEEAAEMFLSGKPLRSSYRVMARDGRVLWFQCEAKMIRREDGRPWFIHGVGFDITERKGLEEAILEISAREQRRIAQDLHDGLGQHLTGIAFMSKVLEEKLSDKTLPEAVEAAQIVKMVNQAIDNTRATGPRPASGGRRTSGINVRAEKMGQRSGSTVSHRLRFPLREAAKRSRCEHGHPSLSHRARSREQRDPPRQSQKYYHSDIEQGRRRHAFHSGRWRGVSRTAGQSTGSRSQHHELSRGHGRRLAESSAESRPRYHRHLHVSHQGC